MGTPGFYFNENREFSTNVYNGEVKFNFCCCNKPDFVLRFGFMQTSIDSGTKKLEDKYYKWNPNNRTFLLLYSKDTGSIPAPRVLAVPGNIAGLVEASLRVNGTDCQVHFVALPVAYGGDYNVVSLADILTDPPTNYGNVGTYQIYHSVSGSEPYNINYVSLEKISNKVYDISWI